MSIKRLQAGIKTQFVPNHGALSESEGGNQFDIGRLSQSHQKLWRNLEHASRFPPFSQGTGCLGRIDYSKELEDRSVVVRGWLFHYLYKIESLFLSSAHVSVRVHLYKLLRTDVEVHFGHLPHSRNCGFMAILPPVSFTGDQSLKKLEFMARLEDGSTQYGSVITFDGTE
jgi:hypothetical protein